jgi:hypothetical protein
MSRKKLAIGKKNFTPLGERIDVLLVTLGLKATEFAKKLPISDAYLSKLCHTIGKGGDKIWRGIRREFPEWETYLRGESKDPPIKPYAQEEEHMLPQKDHEAPDSGPGQLRLPSDLSDYRVVHLIRPEEGQRQRLHARLEEILDSGDRGLITAISCNLEEFARSAQKDRILETVGRKPGILPKSAGDRRPEHRSPSSKPR